MCERLSHSQSARKPVALTTGAQRAVEACSSRVRSAALPADKLPSYAFLLNHVLGEKLGAWPESVRVFRTCPLVTPKDTRSSLQMLAIARAMAALCASYGRVCQSSLVFIRRLRSIR